MKPQNVMNEDWQYLVILDACRYDMFSQCCQPFLNGILERRRSPATFTIQWLARTFTDYYDDISYISSVGWCRNHHMEQKGYMFDGRKHFNQVIYIPDNDLDKITDTAVKMAMRHPKQRYIVHYMCPHAPYHSVETNNSNIQVPHITKNMKTIWQMKMLATNILMKTLGNTAIWRIKKRFGLPAYSMEAAWRQVGANGVREAYADELILGLKHVKKLSLRLPPGKMVISADHGELLGEKGYWGHGIPKPPLPALTDVPWLEVER